MVAIFYPRKRLDLKCARCVISAKCANDTETQKFNNCNFVKMNNHNFCLSTIKVLDMIMLYKTIEIDQLNRNIIHKEHWMRQIRSLTMVYFNLSRSYICTRARLIRIHEVAHAESFRPFWKAYSPVICIDRTSLKLSVMVCRCEIMFIFISSLYSNLMWERLRGVVANVPDSDIVVSQFEFQSGNYVHF